jgi:hypothetical protein
MMTIQNAMQTLNPVLAKALSYIKQKGVNWLDEKSQAS